MQSSHACPQTTRQLFTKSIHQIKLKIFQRLVTFGEREGGRGGANTQQQLWLALPWVRTTSPGPSPLLYMGTRAVRTGVLGASLLESPWVLLLVWDCSAEFITHLLPPTHLLSGSHLLCTRLRAGQKLKGFAQKKDYKCLQNKGWKGCIAQRLYEIGPSKSEHSPKLFHNRISYP